MLGIMSPDVIDARFLRLRNKSRGYVVFRITAPGVEPLLTPALPPGAQENHEMLSRFGTLCPESLKVEIAAYSRARPQVSPLEDETLNVGPCAACAVELLPTRHYGCSADLSWVSLDGAIDCNVLEVDEPAGAIGFQAGWLAAQRQVGIQIENPPPASPPDLFPLNGRIVNLKHQPLAGVEIRLPQLDASVFTDAQGRFSVPRPAGVYLLEAVLPGIEISPMLREFSHFSPDEVPIEFIALTETVPEAVSGGQTQ
jgi:hypothetical protein